jgi:hypothetical protein
MSNHFTYTLSLPNTPELYEFDASKSRLSSSPEHPFAALWLTRPLAPIQTNHIFLAEPKTRFACLIIRQYDAGGTLVRVIEHKDVGIITFNKSAPNLILEYKFKP